MKIKGRRKSKNVQDITALSRVSPSGNRQIAAIRATAKRTGVQEDQKKHDFAEKIGQVMDHEKSRRKSMRTRGNRIKGPLAKMTSGMDKAAKRDYDKKVKKAR